MRPLDNGSSGSSGHTMTTNTTTQGVSNLPHGAASCSNMAGLAGAPGSVSEDRVEAASSDSAVSSMGSERVPPMTEPSISDNDWVDPDGHSHDSSHYSTDYSRY